MPKIMTALIVLITAPLAGGCGTALSLTSGNPIVYGGTVIDLIGIRTGIEGVADAVHDKKVPKLVFPIVILGALLDLPVSLAADTALLPATLWITFGPDRVRRLPRSYDTSHGSAPLSPSIPGVALPKPPAGVATD